MPSFFEKLKKGMRAESNFEEPEEETPLSSKKQKPVLEKKQIDSKSAVKKEKSEERKKELSLAAKQEKKSKKPEFAKEVPLAEIAAETEFVPPAVDEKLSEIVASEKITVQPKEEWPESEGELVVDVYQTDSELIVQSAVAGIKPEELNIDIEKDVLVIRGARNNNDCEKRDYFFQECYWGAFSRQIILPVEVDSSRVKAEMREGVLTIRMPKIIREGKKKINVQAI